MPVLSLSRYRDPSASTTPCAITLTLFVAIALTIIPVCWWFPPAGAGWWWWFPPSPSPTPAPFPPSLFR